MAKRELSRNTDPETFVAVRGAGAGNRPATPAAPATLSASDTQSTGVAGWAVDQAAA